MKTQRTRTWVIAIISSGLAMNACGGHDSSSLEGPHARTSALQASFGVTDDASISNENPGDNGGNGVTTTSGEMMVWNLTGTDGYSEEALLRFGSLSLPAGATVTGASLALTFDNWSTGFTVQGYYVKNAWQANSALGWLNRDSGVPWATPGARGSGTDVQASPTFTIGGFSGTGVEPKTIALDPAVVQGWLDNPSSNQGVLLVNLANDQVTRIYSSEDADPSRRPALTITYSTAGGGGSGGTGGSGTGGTGGSVASGSHPRIWLDDTALNAMVAKVAGHSSEWDNLRAACESYNGGSVYDDSQDHDPNLPNIGEDYEGQGYFDPLLNLALCYQIGSRLPSRDPETDVWAAKGSDILAVMARFTNYHRDDGFGIRFYGVGMALGFDFLYPALSASVKTSVVNALDAWFYDPDQGYNAVGFGNGHPHGNYFAGYYAAKAYTALATDGDNGQAADLWTDFNRLHFGQQGDLTSPTGPHSGVQLYYANYLKGGGWAEGWGYGALAVSNMALPTLAVKTAKGIDLVNYPGAPYTYPLENAMHLIQFTWPSRLLMDDRNLLHESTNLPNISYPSRPSMAAFDVTSAMLARWNDPLASSFHAYAHAVRDALTASGVAGAAAPWQEMLFWDEQATESDFSALPRTYLSSGMNIVATRSDWSTTATWASFRASGYVDYGYAGEEYYDAGGLAIVNGGTPLLANAHGVLVTDYPGSIGQQTFEDIASADVADPKPRKLFNTFANGTGIQEQHFVDATSPPRTRVTHVEDGNGFVRMRGDDIQDVYTDPAQIDGWTRDVVYLRPSRFVVYDRTTVADTSGDQHMNWHLFFTPAAVASPGAGTTRYDVTNPSVGFLGSMTTVLPAVSSPVSPIDVGNTHKVFRVEVRPSPAATDTRWLTVFDTSATPGAVALASALPGASTNIKGVLLAASAGNSVVAFGAGAASASIAGAVTFTMPAASTKIVVADLPASSAFAVSAAPSGGSLTVTIQPGSGFQTTANGTLYVDVAAGGGVSAGS